MPLHRLMLCPDGDLLADRIDMSDLDPELLGRFEFAFESGPSFHGSLPGTPDAAVKWTGTEAGQALLSCSCRGELFLSGVLVAGNDVVGDGQVLRMFEESVIKVPLFREMHGERKFALDEQRVERPLLGCVLWPTLPADQIADLLGLDILLSGAFLRRFGSVE